MSILFCPDCGKRYRLQGEPGGKTLRCPQCGTELEPVTDVPLRQRLKHELARLSAVPAADGAAGPGGARIRVAERPPRPTRLWVLWGLLVLVAACAVGGGWWAYARAHRAPPELPAQVRAAIAKAERSDVPGGEEQALADWRSARGMIMVHRIRAGLPDAFQDDIDGIEARVRELQETIRRRRAALPALQQALAEARAALEAGRSREARAALEGLLETVQKADLRETDRAGLRREIEALMRAAASGVAAAPARTARAAAPSAAASSGAPSVAGGRRALAAAARRAPAAGTADVVIDGPAEALRWRAEPWGNPLTVGLEPGAAVVVRQASGALDKWALSMDRQLDVRAYGALAFEVQSADSVKVSVAVWTSPDNGMFEAPVQTVRGGAWQAVSFALKGPGFKCQSTNWQFGAELANPGSVTRVTLLLYGRSQAPVRIRNVRLVRGP